MTVICAIDDVSNRPADSCNGFDLFCYVVDCWGPVKSLFILTECSHMQHIIPPVDVQEPAGACYACFFLLRFQFSTVVERDPKLHLCRYDDFLPGNVICVFAVLLLTGLFAGGSLRACSTRQDQFDVPRLRLYLAKFM